MEQKNRELFDSIDFGYLNRPGEMKDLYQVIARIMYLKNDSGDYLVTEVLARVKEVTEHRRWENELRHKNETVDTIEDKNLAVLLRTPYPERAKVAVELTDAQLAGALEGAKNMPNTKGLVKCLQREFDIRAQGEPTKPCITSPRDRARFVREWNDVRAAADAIRERKEGNG